MHRRLSRIALAAGIMMAIVGFYLSGLHRLLDFGFLQQQRQYLSDWQQHYPGLAMGCFVLAYIAVAALSLPGAAVLTLAGGALFGLNAGVLMVSFASTTGATLAFLSARSCCEIGFSNASLVVCK